jgi:hypothetical protein
MEGLIPYTELKRSYKDIRKKEKKPEKTYNAQMTEGKPYKPKGSIPEKSLILIIASIKFPK